MLLIIVEMHQNLQTRALYLEQSPQTPILSGVENGKMGTGGYSVRVAQASCGACAKLVLFDKK